MGKKKIDFEEVEVYTTLTFTNDDITIIIKNLALEDLPLFADKEKVVSIMYEMWFMYGVYQHVEIEEFGLTVTILSRTKKKIELMIKR